MYQSTEYGRTRQDLVRAEPIFAVCTTCNTICCTRIRGMPKERLSIRRMRVLGAFPAVLDDLNFKCSAGTPLVCSCFTIQFPKKKGYKQDCRQIGHLH